MKQLRNKKTGDISTNPLISVAPFTGGVRGCHIKTYRSAAEFNEEWEDVEDINVPIIKDEQIRKAVRAWAEANKINKCKCSDETHCITFETERGMFISFEYADPIPPEGNFTIAELCGEEE